jgi:hypothetical protein
LGEGQRIIGTTLNQPFYDDVNAVRDDYLVALEQSFWSVYPVTEYPTADLTFDPDDCQFTDDFGDGPCIDNDFLKVYYDDQYQMVLFSDEYISGLTPGLGETICNVLPSWLKWLCAGPTELEESVAELQLFNKIFSSRDYIVSDKEVFGVSEYKCDFPGDSRKWVLTFNYTGFSNYDLSYLFKELQALNATATMNQNNIYIKDPKISDIANLWMPMTLIRNPEQD